MYRKLIALLTAVVVMSVSASAAPWVLMKITYNYNTYDYSAEAVYVNVNGTTLTNLPMQPILLNNTTLVPAREVCEAFGAVVEWKKATEEIYIACGESIVVLKINSTSANVNGTITNLSVPARIINNKTMIPVRFVSEAFNKDVEWNNDERTIYIKDKVLATTTETTQVQTVTESATEATTQLQTSTTETVSEETTQSSTQQQTGNTFDQNIMYDAVNRTLILKNENSSFSTDGNSVEYSEDDKTLTVQFADNVGSSIKEGSYSVGTNGISSIYYAVENGKTTITFSLELQLEANIESDKTYIYITLK